MLTDATRDPVTAVGATFVVHIGGEALNDHPLGLCDVTVTIVSYTIDGLFGKINLNNKPRATALYFGQVTCSTC